MKNSDRGKQKLLRMALLGNAIFSTMSGLTLLAAEKPVVQILGLPGGTQLFSLGVGLLVFALILVLFARKAPIKTSNAWIVVILDVAWIIGSYVVLFVAPLSASGKWVVGVVAEVVLIFALVQWLGIRRIQKGNAAPELAP
jgi:hypothetical protein